MPLCRRNGHRRRASTPETASSRSATVAITATAKGVPAAAMRTPASALPIAPPTLWLLSTQVVAAEEDEGVRRAADQCGGEGREHTWCCERVTKTRSPSGHEHGTSGGRARPGDALMKCNRRPRAQKRAQLPINPLQ